jgi:signal transduction histidine kinase
VHEVGARLLRSGRWMGRMIEDMLDLARTRVGSGMPVKRTRCDLGALAERVAQERQCTAPERALNIKRLGDLVGEWDEDRMAQVVSNLIGNALRHGDAQQPVDIELDGLAANEVVMTVGNGGAIAPDVLPHIFDPFRSGRTPSRRSEGLGLGLYIVQQIVWAHGGTLEVRSDPVQRRTAFTLRLPRGQGSMATLAPPASS